MRAQPLPKLAAEEEETAGGASTSISLWEGGNKEIVVDESAMGMFGDEDTRAFYEVNDSAPYLA